MYSRRAPVRARLGTCAIVLVAILGPVRATAGQLTWERDWRTAFDRARAEQKLVLVDLSATWCRPCVTMEEKVFPQEAVQRRLADFILLRLDYDKNRGRFGVKAIPTFLFFDPNERPHYRIFGAQPATQFAQKLDGIRLRAADTLEAARLLANPYDAAKGHLLLGRTYLRGGELRDAASELEAAAKEATRRGDADTAAFARADAAYVTSRVRGPNKGLKALADLSGREESGRARAYRHLILGRIHQESNDHERAREAFAEAVRAAADDAAIRHQAELALANFPPQPRRTP